jgi:hypothetical protein
MGEGARRFFENSPFGDMTGQDMSNFMHVDDIMAFHSMLEEARLMKHSRRYVDVSEDA